MLAGQSHFGSYTDCPRSIENGSTNAPPRLLICRLGISAGQKGIEGKLRAVVAQGRKLANLGLVYSIESLCRHRGLRMGRHPKNQDCT